MKFLKFPGDSFMLGDTRYRLKRVGRDEWLAFDATPTEDPECAADFPMATDAALFLLECVDEPELWFWEPFFTVTT